MMENWREGPSSSSLWKRKGQDTMEMLRLGIDLPSMEMSTSAMNRTLDIINSFALQQVQQLRYMHIGFGSLSCFLALLVIIRVWYDSWRTQQMSVQLRPRRWAFLYNLHPAESFPLILGFVLFFQALAFVLIQSLALQSVFITKCQASSQVVFTEIFIIGWFHMTFGLDMTIRALKPPVLAAAKRRSRTTTLCVAVAIILTLATWLSTRIRPPGNRCFGDLIFRSIRSSLLGIVLCAVMIPSFLIMAAIISVRLWKTVLMDHNERIAGTRMVYYLLEAAVFYTMILPFWIQAMTGTFDSHLSSSRIAEFVLFSSGAVICLTHFFLRANAARTAIKPDRTPWMKKRKFRFFGPSDLELINISPPILNTEYEPEDKTRESSWTDSRQKIGMSVSLTASSRDSSMDHPSKPESVVSRPQWPLLDDMERPPTPAKTILQKEAISQKGHSKQQSYSLFPGGEDIRLPPTVYSPDKSTKEEKAALTSKSAATLLAPPMLISGDDSRDSTATLQIGMRFSSAPAAAAAARPSTPNNRPSLRTLIDNMIKDPFSYMTTQSQPISSPTSQSGPPEEHPEHTSDDNNQPDNYGWLDLDQAHKSPTKSERVTSVYLTRKESQRRLAESNRQEIANLERSGSGSSRARIRPVYPNPGTPDSSPSSGRQGFF